MTLTRGRVLRAEDGAATAAPVRLPEARLPAGRRVERPIVDAHDRAREIVESAERRAREIVDGAAREVADIRLRAQAEGRAEAAASLAARAIELSTHEANADARALDRSVELARLLAERLLGEALALEPTRVTALARQALSEARGARAVRIVAHPEDVAILSAQAQNLGITPEALRFDADPRRARGHLRLETEIGTLDAELGPQLERLARRLRESMGR